MKTFLRLKILILVILTGFVFSCKNNKDGYSDEIETNSNPVDSAGKETDTAKSINDHSIGVEDPQNRRSGDNGSGTNAGTGSGPGESPEDGSTYTPSRGLPKDSIKPEVKASKKKE